MPGGPAVAAGMTIAAFVAVPAAVATGGFARVTPGLFAAEIAVALLSSAIPYTLEMVALRELPARTIGIFMSLEPAVAALAGLVFLHEALSLRQWIAVALVVGASTGATLTSRRTQPLPTSELRFVEAPPGPHEAPGSRERKNRSAFAFWRRRGAGG